MLYEDEGTIFAIDYPDIVRVEYSDIFNITLQQGYRAH